MWVRLKDLYGVFKGFLAVWGCVCVCVCVSLNPKPQTVSCLCCVSTGIIGVFGLGVSGVALLVSFGGLR